MARLRGLPSALRGALILLSVPLGGVLTPDPVSAQPEPAIFSSASSTVRVLGQPAAARAPVQSARSSGVLKGALLGAAVGAATGWATYELIVHANPICDASSPDCTVTGPSRATHILVGSAVGLLVGALVGARRSNQSLRTLPRIGPGENGRWTVSLSLSSD